MGETAAKPRWRLKVHNLETCSCNHGCGCQFGGFPDKGFCDAIIGYEVIEGHYGDVDLAGVRTVYVGTWPKAIHEGHGRALLFVDESARPEQVEGLTKIFSGQAGGMPWEGFAATVDTFDGPILKPIEMRVDGHRSSFRVPGLIDVTMTPLKDAVSGEEKEVHIVYPKGGFVWNDGSIGTTTTMSINHGDVHFQYPGWFAAYAVAEWTNQK
jgi:hypothetical protein